MPPGKPRARIMRNSQLCRADELVIVDDPGHPLFDPRANLPVDEGLIENIARHGVLVPVIARVMTERVDAETLRQRYIVVDGRQRVRAVRILMERLRATGDKTVIHLPVTFRSGGDRATIEASVSANEIRFSDDVVTKAQRAAKMRSFGLTAADIAKDFNVHPETVVSWWRLARCEDEVLAAVRDGKLTVKEACALAGTDRAEQLTRAQAIARPERPKPGPVPGRPARKTYKRTPVVLLRSLVDYLVTAPEALPTTVATLLRWTLGRASDGEVVQAFPGLAGYFQAKPKAPKAPQTNGGSPGELNQSR